MATTGLETILIGQISQLNQLTFGRVVAITAGGPMTANTLLLGTDAVRGLVVVVIVAGVIDVAVLLDNISVSIGGVTGKGTTGQRGNSSNNELNKIKKLLKCIIVELKQLTYEFEHFLVCDFQGVKH